MKWHSKLLACIPLPVHSQHNAMQQKCSSILYIYTHIQTHTHTHRHTHTHIQTHTHTHRHTCAAFSVIPQTASARLATAVQNAGVVLLPCLVEALMPVIESASSCDNTYNMPRTACESKQVS